MTLTRAVLPPGLGSPLGVGGVILLDHFRVTSGRMAIRSYVALLEVPAFRRVARALAQDGFPLADCSAPALLGHLHGPGRVSAIIDPTLLSDDGMAEAIAILAAVPRGIVVYAPLTPDGITRALAFARHTSATVLFQAVDQDLLALSHSLVAATDASYARRLLVLLEPQMRRLPVRLRDAIRDMFLVSTGMETPVTLARRSTLCRRSLDRRLTHAGIGSVRLLAAAPQLLRAVMLLHETDLTVRRIAEISEYPSTRRLNNHAIELTGRPPGELRACTDTDALIATIAGKLLRTPRDRQLSRPTSTRVLHERAPRDTTIGAARHVRI